MTLDATATNITLGFDGARSTIQLGPTLGAASIELSTRGIGEIFMENALAAFVTALVLGAPPPDAARAIAAVTPPHGRFELIAQSPHLVVDYAHTPDALLRTIVTARR